MDVAAARPARPGPARYAGRQARQAEQREALREVDQVGVVAQAGAGGLETLGGSGDGDARAQPPPELGLPGGVGGDPRRRRPRAQAREHLRPVERVAVEQVGDVARGAQTTRAADGIGRLAVAAEVRGQARQPRLADGRRR